MRQRFAGVLLSLLLLLPIFPVYAENGANPYKLSVQGVTVTDENKDNILGDNKVKYDPSTKVLTLDNATITLSPTAPIGIRSEAPITIKLVGDNKIADTASTVDGAAIWADSLKLIGDGVADKLEIDLKSSDAEGINIDNDFSAENCTLNIRATSKVINASGLGSSETPYSFRNVKGSWKLDGADGDTVLTPDSNPVIFSSCDIDIYSLSQGFSIHDLLVIENSKIKIETEYTAIDVHKTRIKNSDVKILNTTGSTITCGTYTVPYYVDLDNSNVTCVASGEHISIPFLKKAQCELTMKNYKSAKVSKFADGSTSSDYDPDNADDLKWFQMEAETPLFSTFTFTVPVQIKVEAQKGKPTKKQFEFALKPLVDGATIEGISLAAKPFEYDADGNASTVLTISGPIAQLEAAKALILTEKQEGDAGWTYDPRSFTILPIKRAVDYTFAIQDEKNQPVQTAVFTNIFKEPEGDTGYVLPPYEGLPTYYRNPVQSENTKTTTDQTKKDKVPNTGAAATAEPMEGIR